MSTVEQFITRWESSGVAERANYQLFLSELCDVLGVPHPAPATPDNRETAVPYVPSWYSAGSFSVSRRIPPV